MRGWKIVTLAWLAVAVIHGPVAAEDGATFSAQDHDGIEQTIRSQLDAFRRDDALGAFGFAAPGTQQRFGTADVFMDMVRNAYPPVYHPHGVDFTTLTEQDGAIVQSVELVGPDGAAYTALYTMEREPDGAWRIIACSLVPSQRVGA